MIVFDCCHSNDKRGFDVGVVFYWRIKENDELRRYLSGNNTGHMITAATSTGDVNSYTYGCYLRWTKCERANKYFFNFHDCFFFFLGGGGGGGEENEHIFSRLSSWESHLVSALSHRVEEDISSGVDHLSRH